MPANQKPIFATAHVSGEGNRLPYQPGERIDERLRPEVVKGLMERGLATDSPTAGKRAESDEAERRSDVGEQISGRSEKRDSDSGAARQ